MADGDEVPGAVAMPEFKPREFAPPPPVWLPPGPPPDAPRSPPLPGAISGGRHFAHVLLVVGTVAGMIGGGSYHCVSGGNLDGFKFVRKARWGFQDQFINLDTLPSWDINEHRASVEALVAAGLAHVNEPDAEPAAPRWCYRDTDGNSRCANSLNDCKADRRGLIADHGPRRPASSCEREQR